MGNIGLDIFIIFTMTCFRSANVSGYLLFSSILVIIFLSIIAITIVINAKKTNKLCWANVGLIL